MTSTASSPGLTPPAPQAFRDALAELVQIGMSVARMLGQVAQTEAALAVTAAQAVAMAEGAIQNMDRVTSYVEAGEVGRVADIAIAAQQTAAARAETVAKAFNRVSRSVRMTVLLAERLDRGWARPRRDADDRHAMARRQIARGVAEAIARQADGERAERLSESLADRMETLDVEEAALDRPVDEIITEICRDIGLDAARMVVRPPIPGVAGMSAQEVKALLAEGGRGWEAGPPQRPPDG